MRQMAEPFFDSRMSLALDAFSRDLKSIENLPSGTYANWILSLSKR